MASTTVASIQEVPVDDVFALFRTVLDFTGIYTWRYQWKAKSKKRRKFLVVLLMSLSGLSIALKLFNFVRLLFVISWSELSAGTEMVKVTYCLTTLLTLGVNVVCITSARNNWDLLLEKLRESKGTVGRRLVKIYKFLLVVWMIITVGYSAYIYTSLSELKPGDEMDILTVCRMAPTTPDMFAWDIVKMLYVFLNTFTVAQMYSLLAFYSLASYHIAQKFKVLTKKVIDMGELGHCVTFESINTLRLQYECSVSLTKILDSLLTWQAFLCYSLLLPNIFVFLYGVIRVPLAGEVFPFEFIMGACIYVVIVTSAGTSINTSSKGMEDVLYKIGINWNDDKTTRAYQTFLFRVSTSDVGITALGFFTISQGTVLTMVGTIVSYVIVILQSPTDSDPIQLRNNSSLHP